MKTSPASTPRKKSARKPSTKNTITTKSSTPDAVKSPLGKPAASPARPSHTGSNVSTDTKTTKTTKSVRKPKAKGRAKAPKRPNARDKKPVNNLPQRPSVGMRLRTTMRDLYVIGVKLGAVDRVVCLAVGSGYRFKRTTIQWKSLRTDKGTRWV